jgi:hypothetical protein
VPFICECPQESCVGIVRLTLSEYGKIRELPVRFFCEPGHQAPSVAAGAAVVVAEKKGEAGQYVIVDKVGVAGEIAEERYEHDAR